jgi:hypothetical protein
MMPPWQHSPLELYLKCTSSIGAIGKAGVFSAGLPDHSTNLFGYIFDLGGTTQNYGHPDNLHVKTRDLAAYPVLARSTTKIFNKRDAEKTAYDTSKQNFNNSPYGQKKAMLAMYRSERDKKIFSRIAWNRKVGKLRRELESMMPTVAEPVKPIQAKKQAWIAGGQWQALGVIGNADPFGTGMHQGTIDYEDHVLGMTGVVPPNQLTLQNAISSSRTQRNPAVTTLVNSIHGHP